MGRIRRLDDPAFTSEEGESRDKAGRRVGRNYTVRVLRYFGSRGELGATPKEVSRQIKVSLPTVYRAIRILVLQGRLRKDSLGHYVAKGYIQDILRVGEGKLGVHGIVFAGENYPPGPPKPGHVEPMPIGSWGDFKRHDQGFWQVETSFRNRFARIRWWPTTCTLMVYLSTSRYPLPMAEVGELGAWLEAKADPVDVDVLYWVETSANIDYWDWTFQKGKAIRLRPWVNGHISLYEKVRDRHASMRLELEEHLGPQEVTFREGLEIIANLDPQVQAAKAAQLQAEAEIARAKAEEEEARLERERLASRPPEPHLRDPLSVPPDDAKDGGYG